MSYKKVKVVEGYSSDDVADVHRYGLDLTCNHLYLVGSEDYINHDNDAEPGVEYSMASRLIKNLNIIMRQNDSPILLHMKTCGGYWEEGMAIYDILKACPNKITILNYTHARSMSSLIFQAADKRVMMPNSTFMFHEGTFEFAGTQKQLRTEFTQNQLTNDVMLEIYTDSMKKSGKMKKSNRETIKKWLQEQMDRKEEVYLSAGQTVEYGFADSIFGQDGSYNWQELTEGY